MGYLVYHMEEFAYKVWIDEDHKNLKIEKYNNEDKEVE